MQVGTAPSRDQRSLLDPFPRKARRGRGINEDAMTERAIGIPEFCKRYSVGRTTTYGEIAAGRLRTKKSGKRTLIPIDSAEAWFEGLPEGGPRRSGRDSELGQVAKAEHAADWGMAA